MNTLTFEKLREKNSERGDEWNGRKMDRYQKICDLLFRSNEMAGEVGEACNSVKKFERMRAGMVGGISEQEAVNAVAEELADVIICADRVAEVFDIRLDEAIVAKFNKTSEKYGLKTVFDTKVGCAACDRGDYQIGHHHECPNG